MKHQMRHATFLIFFCFCIPSAAHAQIFKEYTPGYYYNANGQKISGVLHIHLWEDNVLYKTSKDADKEKIYIDDLKAVIIDGDSVCIKTYPKGSKFKSYFAKLAIDGPVKIFYKFEYHNSTPVGPDGRFMNVSNKISPTAVYQVGIIYNDTKKEPMFETGDTTEPITKKNFKEVMAKALAQYPETLQDVESGKLQFKDLEAIVFHYQTSMLR